MTDYIVHASGADNQVRIFAASTRDLVEKAREIHNTSPVATAALGRLLTMGVIMGSDLKSEKDNITLQIKGDGPIGKMVAVVNKNLKIKGMVDNPQVDAPLNEFGKLDVGGVVGYNGYVNVIKDIGLKEPYIGVIPISSGEIAEDFARYFTESEQTRSAVALGVLVDKNGVKRNFSILGGEPLCPENREYIADLLSKVRKQYPNIKIYIWTGYVLDQLLNDVTFDYDKKIFSKINYLIDGPFIQSERDLTLELRGSKNQCIIGFL